MGKKGALIGRRKTAFHGEFIQPRREVFVYFDGIHTPTFGAGVCRIPPGSSNESHGHADADEIIYVITGEMRIVLEGDTYYLEQGDAILVQKDQVHQIFNNSTTQDLVHTFTFSPGQPASAIRSGYNRGSNFRVVSEGLDSSAST